MAERKKIYSDSEPGLQNSVQSVQSTVGKTKVNVEGEYKDIFSENIPSSISKKLMKISKLREFFI